MLYAFEGIDGSGKSTITRYVSEQLTAIGYTVLICREPTFGRYGKQVREASQVKRLPLEKEVELLIKDRQDDVEQNITPAINAGKIVLLDRYYYSHVYQAVLGANLSDMLSQNRAFSPEPNLVIIFDIPACDAIKRISASRPQTDKFEENIETLELVRNHYLAFQSLPHVRIVNANRPLEMVQDDAIHLILGHLHKAKSA